MDPIAAMWEELVMKAGDRIGVDDFLSSLPNVCVTKAASPAEDPLAAIETFDCPGPWDRTMLELEVENPSADAVEGIEPPRKKMLLFSGNDYLNLSTHPAVRQAFAKAALVYGMGPRSASLISGYTDYHRLLEQALTELTKKEACLITPTGFSAITALLATLGSIATLTGAGRRPAKHEKIAIFSDALNQASIIDGLHMMERQKEADVFVYRHNDMKHLDELLSNCQVEKKVVFTDSLFTIEGDFAPMLELVELRKKHGFLFIIDDAHTTLVCGKNGGGIAEIYGIEDQIDICVGTLSMGIGSLGGFIVCSKNWRKLIQGTGRSFIFSTASPLPVIVAAYDCANHCSRRSSSINHIYIYIYIYIYVVAVTVAKKESWRREAIWSRVKEFTTLTKYPVASPIITLMINTEQEALDASKHMLESGFHVTTIIPPVVPANACRLGVTLNAAHTSEDIQRLVVALFQCISSLKGAC